MNYCYSFICLKLRRCCTLLFLFIINFFVPVLPSQSQEARLYKADIPYYSKRLATVPLVNIPNMVTVDYQFHHGKSIMTNGKRLVGWFSFAPSQPIPDILYGMKLKQPEKVEYKTEVNGPVVETIDFDQIKRLAVEGKDPMVLSDCDSTIFLQKGKMLLRLRSEKPIPLYDDLYIVDELANQNFIFWRVTMIVSSGYGYGIAQSNEKTARTFNPANTVMEWVDASAYAQLRATSGIYYDSRGKVKIIEKWEEVSPQFHIDPFIKDVVDALNKVNSYDIGFGIVFSLYDKKQELVPFFEPIEVRLKDGKTLNGTGFIIPFRYNLLYRPDGWITFYDGSNFSLIYAPDVIYAKYRNKTYTPVFSSHFKQWFMTYPFEFKGQNYQVAEGHLYYKQAGFFNESGAPYFHVFYQNGKGIYVNENNVKIYDELVELAR
jgi:hypothetical protein